MSPKDINLKVVEQLSIAGDKITNIAIDRLVTAEVEKRSAALFDAIKLAENAQREFYKVNKPDQQLFDSEGKVSSESYTKARLEEIKKTKEKLAKIEKAIEMATSEKPDYSKLYELKSSPAKDSTQSGATDTAAS